MVVMFSVYGNKFRGPKSIGVHPERVRSAEVPPVDSENWTNILPYLENGAREDVSYCHSIPLYNRKSRTSFRLVPKSETLNDLAWRNGCYFALFCRFR